MMCPVITILLGDPRLPDRSKPSGCFTTDYLDQLARLRSVFGELAEYSFEYRDDHERLLDDLRTRSAAFVPNFCNTGFRNEAALGLHLACYLEMLGIPLLQLWTDIARLVLRQGSPDARGGAIHRHPGIDYFMLFEIKI